MASDSPTLSPTSKVSSLRAEASSADDVFCTHNRRCNRKFLESISSVIKQYPYADLTSIMHKYDEYRDRLIDEDETILNESITFPSPQLPDFEEGVEEELKKEYKLGAVSSVSFSAGKGSEKLLKDGTTSSTKMEAAKPKKRCRCNKDEKQIIELQLGVKKSKIKA